MNINRIQHQQKIKPKKENIIENEIEKEQEFNNNKIINSRKNDILSEILFKIQDFKQRNDNFDNIRDNYNSNKVFSLIKNYPIILFSKKRLKDLEDISLSSSGNNNSNIIKL